MPVYSPQYDPSQYWDAPQVPQPYVPTAPIRTEEDPRDIFNQERPRAWELAREGDEMLRRYGLPEYEQQLRYQQLGDAAYEPILAGEGGYRPEEQDTLRDDAYLRGLQITPQEISQRYLMPNEREAIVGDPYSGFDYYDPSRFDEALYYGGTGQLDALGARGGTLQDLYRDPSLSLSEEFTEGYRLTPEQIQQQADLAGKTAARRYGAAWENLDRVAGASGSPAFARAAMGDRLRREAAIDVADAGTRARLDAEMANIGLLGEREARRLGAEQYRTGLGTETEFGLLGQELGTQRDIRDAALGTEEYLQNTGIGLEQYGEGRLADRQRDVALNRQGVTRDVQGERYGRGMDIGRERYGRERDISQERLGQEREARGYLTGKGEASGGRFQQALDRQAQQRMESGRQSIGTAADLGNYRVGQKSAGNFFTRNILPLFGGTKPIGIPGLAEGGIVTKPTIALIGEAGPEAVVPLTSNSVLDMEPVQREKVKRHKAYMGGPRQPYSETPTAKRRYARAA